MSNRVWERLLALGLASLLTHEDRVAVDSEIESRKNMNCDTAMERGLVSNDEFRQIVALILLRRKKKPMEIVV